MWRCLLLSLFVIGCKHDEEKSVEKLPIVRVQLAVQSRLAPRIPIAGVLTPLPGKDVKVGALVPGRVDQVFVSEGDAVSAVGFVEQLVRAIDDVA